VPSFSYLVIDAAGRRRVGQAESPSLSALTSKFELDGEFIVNLRATDAQNHVALRTRSGASKRLLELTRSLAALIPAGLPLAEAIQTAAQMADASTRTVLIDVRERVERGETLAVAMAASPSLFPAHYVALIAAGERSGTLSSCVTKLGAQLEHEDRLRSRLFAAAIYPILLSTACTCSALLLVGFVLPRFAILLETTGARLPALAAFSLRLSQLARIGMPFIVPAILIVIAVLALFARTKAGVLLLSSALNQLPVIGTIRRERFSSQIARLTGMLLSGGVPLSQALDAAVAATEDATAYKEFEAVRDDILNGTALSDALTAREFFPELMTRLVVLGERSGRLPEFLLQTAEYYDERLQEKARKLIAIVEPLVILVFGGVVGMIALALLQTVYGVNANNLR
jgi:type II secretory pathway component PulF